jgi:hypothetical protein
LTEDGILPQAGLGGELLLQLMLQLMLHRHLS